MKQFEFSIAVMGLGGVEMHPVGGYRLTPNFACYKCEDRRDHPWVLIHIGSGRTAFWHRTRAACLADAQKLEAVRTPSCGRFHWETVTVGNARRRIRALGRGAISRAVGRKASVRKVG